MCVCVCAYMPGLITDGYMLFEIENFKDSKNEMILEIFQLPQVRGGKNSKNHQISIFGF